MSLSIFFLFLRIISNPLANFFQKKLSANYLAPEINFWSYLAMGLFVLPFLNKINFFGFSPVFWGLAGFAGLLCFMSTIFLIKALETGEMSSLSPINSYKCIVGLIFAAVFLGEIPSLKAVLGIILIIYGTNFIFEEGLSIKLFKRKEVVFRFIALFLSGIEAVVLKKIILLSSPFVCFVFWVLFGVFFSFLFGFGAKKIRKLPEKKDIKAFFLIGICLFVMQLSTNFVFKNLDTGLSLALFQLSGLIGVIIGWKFFKEKEILKKLTGSVIMIIGAGLILI